MARKSPNQKLLDALAALNKSVEALSNKVDGLDTTMGGTPKPTPNQPYRQSEPPQGKFGSAGAAWRGSSFAFGDDYRLLSANLRSGLVGEPSVRSALTYGSFGTGLPARRIWENTVDPMQAKQGRSLTHDELQHVEGALGGSHQFDKDKYGYLLPEGQDTVEADGKYKGWRMASNTLGATAMGITAAQNLGHAAMRFSNLGAGAPGSLDPYLQVGGPGTMGQGDPVGNLGSGSPIWEKKKQGIESMWNGFTNFNWSGSQEAQLRNQFLAMGTNPDDPRIHGGLGMIRDLSRTQGIDSGTLTGMAEPIVRRGDTKSLEEFKRTMEGFSEAARKANLNTQAAAVSLAQFAQGYEQQTGVNRNTSLTIGSSMLATQNVMPTALGQMTQSPMFQSLALTAGSKLDPRHPWTAGLASAQGQHDAAGMLRKNFLMPMMGITDEHKINSADARERYHMMKQTGALDQFGMGGMGQADFVKFMTKDLSKKEQDSLVKKATKSEAGAYAHGEVKIMLDKDAKRHLKANKRSVALNFTAKDLHAAAYAVPGVNTAMMAYDGLNAAL